MSKHTVTLTIEYRSSPGRTWAHTDGGTLLDCNYDGLPVDTRKVTLNQIYRRLMDHGYEPAGRVWLSRTLTTRTQRQTFTKTDTPQPLSWEESAEYMKAWR